MKPKKPIESLILTIRGQKVILDLDLADLYGAPTKVLNKPSSGTLNVFQRTSYFG